jgi:hypothetical protein
MFVSFSFKYLKEHNAINIISITNTTTTIVASIKNSTVSNRNCKDDFNQTINNSKSDYDEQNTSMQFQEKRIRLLQSIFNSNNYIDAVLSSMQKQNYSIMKQRSRIDSILKSFRERIR